MVKPRRFSGHNLRPVHSSPYVILSTVILLFPELSFADVESSLQNIRIQLTGTILPILSVIGLGLASLSFFTGNPQAKVHVTYAILGCIFGFGAQQIVDLISRMVR